MVKSGNSAVRRRNSTRKRPSRGNIERAIAPPPSTISYSGPIAFPQTDETTVTLYDSFDITATTGGPLVFKFDNNPSSARNWTEYSTAWNNYRVLGIRYRYYPRVVVNTTSATGPEGLFGVNTIVHGIVPSPTTLPTAMSIGQARPWVVFDRFTREWRMQEVAEATYGLCSAPALTSNTLIMYASAPGITFDYGTVMIEYLVQFKTHVQ